MKWRTRVREQCKFKTNSPFLKAFMTMGASMLILFVIFNFLEGESNEKRSQDDYLAKSNVLTAAKDMVIVEPPKEEITFRGPAWLILMSLLGIEKWLTKRGNAMPWPKMNLLYVLQTTLTGFSRLPKFIEVTLSKTQILHIIVWPVIVLPTIIWAAGHIYPFLMFTNGLVFGWLLIRTHSLIKVIMLHMALNAAVLVGILFRIYLL